MGVGMWEGDTDTEEFGVEETAQAEAIMAELETAAQADAAKAETRAATSDRIIRATSEAEARFEKASLYKTLLQGSLFEENSGSVETVAEVEQEIKCFVLERFETLIGLKAPKAEAPAQSAFSPEETEALRFLAKRIMGNEKERAPKKETPKVPTLKKAPVQASPALRSRGSKLPEAKPAVPTAAVQAQAPKNKVTASAEVVAGVSQLAKKQGKKLVVTPDGRVGKISKASGAQFQPGPGSARPLPMPSPEEQMGKAMAESALNTGNNPLLSVAPVYTKIMQDAAKRVEEDGGEEN